jgi:hypothetical protein
MPHGFSAMQIISFVNGNARDEARRQPGFSREIRSRRILGKRQAIRRKVKPAQSVPDKRLVINSWPGAAPCAVRLRKQIGNSMLHVWLRQLANNKD